MSLLKNLGINKVSTDYAERNQTNTWINSNNVACFNTNNLDNFGRIACNDSLTLNSRNCQNPLDRVKAENNNRPSKSNNLYLNTDTLNENIFSSNFLPSNPSTNKPENYQLQPENSYMPLDKTINCSNQLGPNAIAEISQKNRISAMMHHLHNSNNLMKQAGMD